MPPIVRIAIRSLYTHRVGRALLTRTPPRRGSRSTGITRGLTRDQLERVTASYGRKYEDAASTGDIAPFIARYGVDMSESLLPVDEFGNFNQFFYRRLRPSARPIFSRGDATRAVSPNDCRLLVFPTVDEATRLWIKGSNFTVPNLLADAELSRKFVSAESGALEAQIAVCRLAPQDHRRSHFAVDLRSRRQFDGRRRVLRGQPDGGPRRRRRVHREQAHGHRAPLARLRHGRDGVRRRDDGARTYFWRVFGACRRRTPSARSDWSVTLERPWRGASLQVPSHRPGSSAFAVGMLRDA